MLFSRYVSWPADPFAAKPGLMVRLYESCRKASVLCSRSRSLWSFKISVVCPDDIFWMAVPFVFELGIVMHYYQPECYAKRSLCCLQGPGHSNGLCNQTMTDPLYFYWMFVYDIFPVPLISLWQPPRCVGVLPLVTRPKCKVGILSWCTTASNQIQGQTKWAYCLDLLLLVTKHKGKQSGHIVLVYYGHIVLVYYYL